MKKLGAIMFCFWCATFFAVETLLGILAVPAWVNWIAGGIILNNGIWLLVVLLLNASHRHALDVVENVAVTGMNVARDTAIASSLVAVTAIHTSRNALRTALQTGKAEWVLKLPDGRVGPVEVIDDSN